MNDQVKAGFTYTVEVIRKATGEIVEREVVHNLVPNEGLDYMALVALGLTTQVSNWFVVPFEGDYTPQANDTMATFPASAVESTAYAETSRPEFVGAKVATGKVTNIGSRASFNFTAAKTIYGVALSSMSVKGSTTGLLVSAARFASPKAVSDEYELLVTTGLQMTSA